MVVSSYEGVVIGAAHMVGGGCRHRAAVLVAVVAGACDGVSVLGDGDGVAEGAEGGLRVRQLHDCVVWLATP